MKRYNIRLVFHAPFSEEQTYCFNNKQMDDEELLPEIERLKEKIMQANKKLKGFKKVECDEFPIPK